MDAARLASMDDSLRSVRFYSVIGTVALVIMCGAVAIAVFMLAEESRRTLKSVRQTAIAAAEAAASITEAVDAGGSALQAAGPALASLGPTVAHAQHGGGAAHAAGVNAAGQVRSAGVNAAGQVRSAGDNAAGQVRSAGVNAAGQVHSAGVNAAGAIYGGNRAFRDAQNMQRQATMTAGAANQDRRGRPPIPGQQSPIANDPVPAAPILVT